MANGCTSSSGSTVVPVPTVVTPSPVRTTVTTTTQTTALSDPSNRDVEDDGSDKPDATTGTSTPTPNPTTSLLTNEQAEKIEKSTTTSLLPTPTSPPVTSGFLTMEPREDTDRFVTIEPDG
jgi:uncharacterized membrane protein